MSAGWWKRDCPSCSNVVPLLGHGCLQEGKCEECHKMNCLQLILIKYCLVPSCVERHGNLVLLFQKYEPWRKRRVQHLGFVAEDTACMSTRLLWTRERELFVFALPLPLKRGHITFLSRGSRKLAEAVHLTNCAKCCLGVIALSYQELGFASCCFQPPGLEVLMGSKCHLTLGQIGWVSNLLRLVRLKHFKTNK